RQGSAAALSFFFVFQNIAGLAVQSFADRLHCRESDGFCFSVFQYGNIGHRNADLLGEFGDAHLPPGQHDVDVDDDCHVGYTVRSFSDFMSTAFCRIRSTIAAAVATTIEGKAMRMRMKRPAGRSSRSPLVM